MHKQFKIFAIVGVIVLTFSILFVPYFTRASAYEIGFSKIKIGQSKDFVVKLMGNPSETKRCKSNDYAGGYYRDRNCFEVLNYYSIFKYWAIAFDGDGKVIQKFRWSFDDGHGAPPNSD